MLSRPEHDTNSNSRRSLQKKRPPLTLEQLETRMLMAFDMLDHQLDSLQSNAPDASSQAVVSSQPVVNSLSVRSSGNGPIQLVRSGNTVTSGQRIISPVNQVQLQLLPNASGVVPNLNWQITSTDSLAHGIAQQTGNQVTLTFNRPVDYRITASNGSTSLRFNVRVTPSLTSLTVGVGANPLSGPLIVTSNNATLTVNGLNELGRRMAISGPLNWQVLQAPQDGNVNFQAMGSRSRLTFDRAGMYLVRVSTGDISRDVAIQVTQTMRSITVASSQPSANIGSAVQFTATARDQFGQPMAQQPVFAWSATGGTIFANGLYQAGSRAGNFQITARSGSSTARASISLIDPNNSGFNRIQDQALRSLVTTFYADSVISREEMMQLIRSAGANSLTATELTDLRFIVSANSNLRMPEFVRTLGSNVVNSNPANLRFQGQAAGNLAAGSSETLVNNLVNKWFVGADLPALTGSGITYRNATGSLFPTDPRLSDSQQGMLGDCYFLASLISIAVINQTAIRNMFIENSDGTVTVRFFQNGRADFVTVNRSLPTNSWGGLAYNGFGRSVTNASTPLWLTLAEKAYAQWNETGKAGRNGTNTYAGIEGGWMSNVNAQVLGYASSNFAVNGTNKQALINALNSGQAVTIGTNPGATVGGLVGSHAYVVTGYNVADDTFEFFNPWNFQHPTPLTWAEMQGQTSFFVVTSPNGPASNGTIVRSDSSQLDMAIQTTYFEVIVTSSRTERATVDVDSDIQSTGIDSLIEGEFKANSSQAIAHQVADYIHAQQENRSVDNTIDTLDLMIELNEWALRDA